MSHDDNEQRLQSYQRRLFLQRSSALAGMVALGGGSYILNPKGAWAADPIKVGIATDLTGAIGYAGVPNANVAKMVVEEINAAGGLLGRPLQIFLEDTASNEQLAVTRVRKLVSKDKVDVVFGGELLHRVGLTGAPQNRRDDLAGENAVVIDVEPVGQGVGDTEKPRHRLDLNCQRR